MTITTKDIVQVEDLITSQEFGQARKLTKRLLNSTDLMPDSSDLRARFLYCLGLVKKHCDLLDSKDSAALEEPFLDVLNCAEASSVLKAQANNQLALISVDGRNFEQADRYIESGFSELTNENSKNTKAYFELSITRVYRYIASSETTQAVTALEDLTKHFQTLDAQRQQDQIIELLLCIFALEESRGNLELAAKTIDMARKICEIQNQTTNITFAEILLSQSAISLDRELRDQLLSACLNIYKRIFGYSKGKTRWILMSIANSYQMESRVVEASKVFKKIISIESRTGVDTISPYAKEMCAQCGTNNWIETSELPRFSKAP